MSTEASKAALETPCDAGRPPPPATLALDKAQSGPRVLPPWDAAV